MDEHAVADGELRGIGALADADRRARGVVEGTLLDDDPAGVDVVVADIQVVPAGDERDLRELPAPGERAGKDVLVGSFLLEDGRSFP